MGTRRPHSAFILIVVVALTSVLSLLAVTFAMTARLERAVSANYVDGVRARMLAFAGIDAAMTRLRTDATRRPYNSPADPWVYVGTYAYGVPQPETPLERADVPSYAAGTFLVDAQRRGYSGALAGTYTPLGDTYALKITDMGAGINLNGQETHLASMLDALGRGIQRLDGRSDPVRGRGSAIIALRESRFHGRFKTFGELEEILSKPDVSILRDYVTLDSWRDASVIEPHPQDRATWPVEHYDFAPPADFPGRYPVNVNTAPTPVLFACVAGLSARIRKNDTLIDVPPITDGQAQAVAQHLGEARRTRPFTSWDQFEEFCRTTLGSLQQYQIGAFLANANPNCKLNKFVPEGTEKTSGLMSDRPADKTDLTYATTEFTLWDLGWFYVESLGRVLDPEHRLVADARLRAVVKLYDLQRHTTQRDFVAAAERPEAAAGVRTFPENMADQGGDAARASVVDGRVQIREDDALDGDEVFWLDNDDTLAPRLHGGLVHERRYTSLYDRDRQVRRRDLLENRPADLGLPGVPSQYPPDPTLTNAGLEPRLRNATWGSDLLSDGQFASALRGRVALYPGVERQDGEPFVDPEGSTVQFWIRQDPRAGLSDGLFTAVVPGAGQPIPAGPGPGQDLYGIFLGNKWLNGGHCSWLTGGVVPSECRRSRVVYPFGKDYLWLGVNPSVEKLPVPGYWTQVRMEVDRHTTLRLYLHGALVDQTTATFQNATCNATNVVDMMQFGQVYVHSYVPSFDWIGWSDAVIDTVRIWNRVGAGRNHPDRFPVSNGGTYYEGAFHFGTRPVKVMAVAYSQSRPKWVATGGRLVRIENPPRVSLEVRAEGGAWIPVDGAGDGAPLDLLIHAGEKLEYRARFYDNGLSPNNVAASLEDVTVLYSATGPEIRGWMLDSP